MLDFENIVHTLWNQMTIDQRDRFLRKPLVSALDIDCEKLWCELTVDEARQITQWFLERLGLA